MSRFKKFLLAIAAGICIAVGGTVFLSVENKVVGSVLFAVGLYAIVVNGLYLFTGKIGYVVVERSGSYAVDLVLTWLGNLLGTGLAALAIGASRISGISQKAAALCETKNNDTPFSIFFLSFFCGLLMFVAVDGYKQKQQPLILLMCVSVFILCGFEHCVANMFYYSVSGAWSLKAFAYLLIMTLGNGIGGILIPSIGLIKEKKTRA